MEIAGLHFTGCPCDNPRHSIVTIPEDKFDIDNDKTKTVKYDRTILFPITRWMQMNKEEKITHEKLYEFRRLCSEVHSNWVMNSSEEQNEAWSHLVNPVQNTIMHLWDVEGTLKSWIVGDVCKVLMGTRKPDSLPYVDVTSAYRREKNYRGGLNSLEMSLANLSSAALKQDDKPYSKEEMNEAREKERGVVNYEYNLEPYLLD